MADDLARPARARLSERLDAQTPLAELTPLMRAALGHEQADAPMLPEELEDLLTIVGHARIRRAIEAGELGEAQSAAVMHAVERIARALGVRAVGTLTEATERARQRFVDEQRRRGLVTERAEDVSRDKLIDMLTGYLTTRPAPSFAAAMRRDYPEAMKAAEQAWASKRRLDLPGREVLLAEAKRARPFTDLDACAEALANMTRHIEEPRRVLRGVLRAPNDEAILIASMLAGWLDARDFANAILTAMFEDGPYVDILGVVAAYLHPKGARQSFSLLLADVSWGNPEEPENQLTPERLTTIVTVRTLLPKVGSPLPELTIGEQLPEKLYDENMRTALKRLDTAYTNWGALLDMR